MPTALRLPADIQRTDFSGLTFRQIVL